MACERSHRHNTVENSIDIWSYEYGSLCCSSCSGSIPNRKRHPMQYDTFSQLFIPLIPLYPMRLSLPLLVFWIQRADDVDIAFPFLTAFPPYSLCVQPSAKSN